MKKQTKVFLLLLAALCLLTACKKGEETLEVYSLGESEEDNVVALDTILMDGEAILASIDSPTDIAVTEGLDVHHTYHYKKMADPAALAGRYIALLTSEEQGFVAMDGENHKLLDPPATDTLVGTVSLGKKAADNEEAGKRIVRVLVGWSEYAVAVQVTYLEGSIKPPVVEKEDEETQGGAENTPQATGVKDQLEYFNSLDPMKLGLTGENMSDYMIYPQQGWVMVDDVECREIMVYQMDPQTATNQVVGTFYLSSDLTRVYKKTDDNQITPVQVN